MESETNLEFKEVSKNPEVSEDLKAAKAKQLASSNEPELLNESPRNAVQLIDYSSSASDSDDAMQKAPKRASRPPPSEQAQSNGLNLECAEVEPRDFTEFPEWENMNYSEQMTFMCFRQAGISREETIALSINEAQEEGIFVPCEQHVGAESTTGPINISENDTSHVMSKPDNSSDESETTEECAGVDPLPADKEEAEFLKHPSMLDGPEGKQSVPAEKDSKRFRHPDCKLTLEEVKEMSKQIITKKTRQRFVYQTYCQGANPEEKLKIFMAMDENKPRIELRKMSKILPKKWRAEFYCRAMKGSNPQSLMRKYLSRPQIQQWLLCKRLKLSESKLLSKMFQRSGDPVQRPLREWFTLFLQEGCVDEAISKVQNLILRGEVAKAGQAQTSDIANHPNNTPSSADAQPVPANPTKKEPTSCRKFGKKSMKRRNKKLKQMSDDQKEVYDRWREQGLTHQDALTIVLRFPGSKKKPCQNVCAWGRCDKHPGAAKPPKRNRNGGKAHTSGTQLPPQLGSEHFPQKKTIFDRVPVPSVMVDATLGTAAVVAGPLELQNVNNNGISGLSNPPVLPGQPIVTTSAPPFLPGQTILPTSTPPFLPGQPILPASAPLAVPGPPVLASGLGIRVPQKSTFVEGPCPDPVGMPSQDPSSDALHLCIVPPKYPGERLSEEQMDSIDNSIVLAISGILNEGLRPIFHKKFRNNGKYEMICKDQLAKKWVQKYVGCMRPILPLRIIPAEPTEMSASAVPPLHRNDGNDKNGGIPDTNFFFNGSGKIVESGTAVGVKAGCAETKNNRATERRNSDKVPGTSGATLSDSRRKNLAERFPISSSTVGNTRKEHAVPQKQQGSQSSQNQSSLVHRKSYVPEKGYMGSSRRDRSFHQICPGPSRPQWRSETYGQYRGLPGQYGDHPGQYRGHPGQNVYSHQANCTPPSLQPHFQERMRQHREVRGEDHSFPHVPYDASRSVNEPISFMGPKYMYHGDPPGSQCSNNRSDGFFLEKPLAMEMNVKRSVPERSPSPDFDKLLKSAKSRLSLVSEPTEKQSPSGGQSMLAPFEHATGVQQRPSSAWSDSPQQVSTSGGRLARDRSRSPVPPLALSYKERSFRSPPSRSKYRSH